MKLDDYLKAKKHSINSFGKLCGLSFGPIVRVIEGRPVSKKCAEKILKAASEPIEIKIRESGRRSVYKDLSNKRYKTRRIWLRIVKKCTKPGSVSYDLWKKRGIKICKRWLNFELFLSDLGYVPDGYASLILKSRDLKEYNLENVEWHKDARLFGKVFLLNMKEKETRPFQMTFDENGYIDYG